MLRYKLNPSQVRLSLNRKEFLKTKENNLENVRDEQKCKNYKEFSEFAATHNYK